MGIMTSRLNSATTALHIAFVANGLAPGYRLWTLLISFLATTNCGTDWGAEVEFVDIESSTGLTSVSDLRDKLHKED